MKKYNVTKSSMPLFEDYVEEIKSIWDTKWLTNMGEKHLELENKLEKYLKVNNITLFTNGHLALENAIKAYNLKGEIITTPYTFISTTHAIVRNGITPVFCDVNPNDFTIDVNKIEKLITKKTSAIVAVHVYGNVCNVEKINYIAKKYNLKVIYDSAHAFGVTLNGEGIGSFGDISMFSFHATKVFNTIEGGALTYNDNNLKDILNRLKNFGITGPESVESIGGNAKMNEFQAAMGLCNIKYVDSNIEKRKILVNRYKLNLSNVRGIKIVSEQKGVTSNYAYFPVVFENYKETRDEVFEKLKSYNIFTRKYFYPISSECQCYKHKYNSSDTPIAKYISERVLTLPLYTELTIEDVDKICEIIKK